MIRSIKILTQSFLLRQHIKDIREIRYVQMKLIQILLANVTDDLSGGFNFCHTHEI